MNDENEEQGHRSIKIQYQMKSRQALGQVTLYIGLEEAVCQC